MKFLKSIFFSYQKVMWYVAQFGGEYGKAGRFINEALLITLYLSDQGIKLSFFHTILFYILIVVIAALIGKFLAIIGVVKYNASLSNNHNPEMIKILKDLEKIKQALNIKDDVGKSNTTEEKLL